MSYCKCLDCDNRYCAFSVLSDSEIKLLCNNHAEVKFKKKEIIIKQGALTTNVVYIKSGMVKEHITGPNKKEEILQIVKAPFFLGIHSIFSDRINQYSLTAVEDTTVCFINSDILKILLKKNSEFTYQMLMHVCKDQINNFHQCVNKIQKCLHGCVADAILFLADHIYESDQFELSITRNDIAGLIGTSRECVSRALAKLSKEGIIYLNNKTLKILNKSLLKKISEVG
jgi:CRP-like cAMP-binding protein